MARVLFVCFMLAWNLLTTVPPTLLRVLRRHLLRGRSSSGARHRAARLWSRGGPWCHGRQTLLLEPFEQPVAHEEQHNGEGQPSGDRGRLQGGEAAYEQQHRGHSHLQDRPEEPRLPERVRVSSV